MTREENETNEVNGVVETTSLDLPVVHTAISWYQ